MPVRSRKSAVDYGKLIRQIDARKRLIERYAEFVIDILDIHGQETDRRVGSCHTRIEEWFTGFAHFSFASVYGMTDMGGNEIKVFYHPDKDEIENNSLSPVLEVYWQSHGFDINECQVKKFDAGIPWQKAFDRAIRNKNQILNRTSKAEIKAKQTATIQMLIREMKRLGLKTDDLPAE